MSKTGCKPFKNKILITSKLEYMFNIFSILFSVVFLTAISYKNYTLNDFNIFYIIVIIIVFGLIYFLFYVILNEDLFIELDNEKLLIKRAFNRGIVLEYDEISDVSISLSDPPIYTRYPKEFIIINRKTDKPIKIFTKPSRIDLKSKKKNFDKKSNFIECINFLSTKTSVIIYIDTMHKCYVNESIIDAKIEWSE